MQRKKKNGNKEYLKKEEYMQVENKIKYMNVNKLVEAKRKKNITSSKEKHLKRAPETRRKRMETRYETRENRTNADGNKQKK